MILVFLMALTGACLADPIKVTTAKLNDGNVIPMLGLGTFLSKRDPDSTSKAIELAIELGYRHIDTAPIYGTEDRVGEAVQKKINDGTIKREDMFITTKLGNTVHAPDQVIPALRESLKNLQMDYVDLYLIHWPVSLNEDLTFNDLDYVDTWRSMEKAQRLGLARSIGVSNFNEEQLTRLMNLTTVVPACNQVEVNPNFTQKKLVTFCKQHGIQIIAYTPLGLMPESKIKRFKDTPAPHVDDPILTKMAEKYNKSTIQIVLRYLVDRGLIPIPRSTKPAHIRSNMEIFDFSLTEDEINAVDSFNLDRRVITVPQYRGSKYYPF